MDLKMAGPPYPNALTDLVNQSSEPSDEMNASGFVPPRAVREDQCNACLNCMISCPDMAIVVEKKKAKVKK